MKRRSFFGMLAGLCVLPFTKRSRWPSYEGRWTSVSREEWIRNFEKAMDDEVFEPPLPDSSYGLYYWIEK